MYTTPASAKKAGGKSGIRLTENELRYWHKCSMLLQEQICREKLHDNHLLQFLISTAPMYLVHNERATGWPHYGAVVLTAKTHHLMMEIVG